MRLFENTLIERLSRVHPVIPALLWTPVITWLLWRSFAVHRLGGLLVVALGAAGLFMWTLAEYLIHRFLFHLEPVSRPGRRLQFMVHGIHHADPDDPGRLLMPPAPALVGTAILYTAFRSALGGAWVDPFFACFLVGYLAYDYIHLTVHHRKPRSRLGKYLRQRHMLHHFATPDARWGVSSPLWDRVFGTDGEPPHWPSRTPVAG